MTKICFYYDCLSYLSTGFAAVVYGECSLDAMNEYSENSQVKQIIVRVLLGILASLVIAFLLYIFPQYQVYQQQLSGKAKLAEAESSRQIRVLEARARLESVELDAQSEVKRAEGTAKAIDVISNKLKGNSEYLQYLYIIGLQENQQNPKDKTVIYIPTEGGIPLPALEAGRLVQEGK